MRRISADEFSTRKHAAKRQAFTLIELMIVVVIIAGLMALLLPALRGANTRARQAQVLSEIRGLESAIAQFKSTYGVEPPSGISLYAAQAGWTGDPNSVAKIRRIWPNFDFTKPRTLSGGSVNLTGAECLVFFLGGILDTSNTTLTGFSRDPADPFAPALGGTSLREGPFFEFKPSRLLPSPRNPAFRVYVDPLPNQQTPYLYLSGYEGRGYQISEAVVGTANDAGLSPDIELISGDLNVVYKVGPGNAQPLKAKSFQIISPGVDQHYGWGGRFDVTKRSHGLQEDVNENGVVDSGEDMPLGPISSPAGNSKLDIFKYDFDNLTNFHNSLLNE